MTIIRDLDETTYHADRDTLSSTGAKLILKSPASYRWAMDNPQPVKAAFDLGTVVHSSVLGVGPKPIQVGDQRTKAGKEEAAQARADGNIPLSERDYLTATGMADAVLSHPTAGAILSVGEPEVSLYWRDDATDVACRGRIDWLHDKACVDLKTTTDASPRGFQRAFANFRYQLQAAWYLQGLYACGIAGLPFVFVAVEKDPPYLVGIYQPNDDAIEHGNVAAHTARTIYTDCQATGQWPGYSPEIEPLALPGWAA